MIWLDRPEQWDRLSDILLERDEAGFDTETYGQPYRTSPQHRTRIHCWSVAIWGTTRSPRGYRLAAGRVLPVEALVYPRLRDALLSITLWGHNAPHDEHSAKNEGVELKVNDTLQWLRVAVPGLGDYGLKSARAWALGKPPRPTFKDLMTYTGVVSSIRRSRERRCVCGNVPCRARQTSWFLDDRGETRFHERVEVVTETTVNREKELEYAVTDMVPGHPRFSEWCDYSAADAVDAIELVDWLNNRRETQHVYPWSRDVSIALAR